jgi:lipoyl(octanoyl) transferase
VSPPVLGWTWLGRVSYAQGLEEQTARRERVLGGDASAQRVLLCEHEPVITLGRNADRGNVLADDDTLRRRGVSLSETSRGGDVTYHGPGQLMVYPVVRLRGGVVEFLASIASALGAVATRLGVPGAEWRRDPAGLWLGDAKLAACGLHLRRRVTMHGFALDVSSDRDMWQLINPCGLGAPVVSIAEHRAAAGLPMPPSVEEVAQIAGPLVCEVLEPTGTVAAE